MTDIVPDGTRVKEVLPEVAKREYEHDEPESLFYVEKATRFIYEVKFFPDCALVRPAHPELNAAVNKISLIQFANEFEEYWGDARAIQDFLWGGDSEGVRVEKK
jgi:exoribonuclease II